MEAQRGKIAILVGGGPAPGINSVIAAATIRGAIRGYEVLGIHGGFQWIMQGNTTQVERLAIETVSRIHFRGGSILGTARDNPTTDPKFLKTTLDSLKKLRINKLITIGGDDTAFSALTLEKHSGGAIRVVHVPKTIDNDLDLPHGANTFGYQTARHVGVGLVKNLMIDAKTTGRWYFINSMGRKAGHLALGIGKAAGTPLTVIPEEFAKAEVPLNDVIDILAGTIIKRMSQGRRDGVAVIAEGVMEKLRPGDLDDLEKVGRDAHGHIRLGEIHFAPVLKSKVIERLAQFGVTVPITTKDIGYELRCAEPIPYDMEYTRDLGFCAAQYVINGGSGVIVSFDDGVFKPLPFREMIDTNTNRLHVRMVQVASEYYYIARRYMLRLNDDDFEQRKLLRNYARVCGITAEEFKKEFKHVIDNDVLARIHKERKKDKSVQNLMMDSEPIGESERDIF